MARSDKNRKPDFVKDQVRERARTKARDLIDGVNQRARQDVDHRLRVMDRDRFDDDSGPEPLCGTRIADPEDLEDGLTEIFTRWHQAAQNALDLGDLRHARELIGYLYSLPLDSLPRLGALRDQLRAEVDGL